MLRDRFPATCAEHGCRELVISGSDRCMTHHYATRPVSPFVRRAMAGELPPKVTR